MFEGRPIVSAFDMAPIQRQLPSLAVRALEGAPLGPAAMLALNLGVSAHEGLASWEARSLQAVLAPPPLIQEVGNDGASQAGAAPAPKGQLLEFTRPSSLQVIPDHLPQVVRRIVGDVVQQGALATAGLAWMAEGKQGQLFPDVVNRLPLPRLA